MFANWKTKISTLGAFLIAVITWLGFLGIDAKTIRQQMTTHYLFLIAALAFSALFATGCFYWWKNSRIHAENAHQKIREWLDNLGYSSSVLNLAGWHWGLNVTSVFPNVVAARSRRYSDLLIFTLSIEPMSAEQRKVFDSMSDSDKQKFNAELAIEAAKSKIAFFSDPVLKDIRIEKAIPITPQLAIPNVVESINEVRFSAIVIWNTITNRFGGQAFEPAQAITPEAALPATQPSPTPNMEASPH
jgi:hypothetical protein